MTSELMVGNFRVIKDKFLRHGRFGTVYEAKNEELDQQVAAEEISLAPMSKENIKAAKEEIDLLTELDFPNLVNVKNQEEDKEILWVFMDFCPYDLEQYYVLESPDYTLSVYLMNDMAAAVKYLHKNDIIHRDIQPTNIQISLIEIPDRPTAKIAGYRNVRDADDPDASEGTTGTKSFMAPELFSPDQKRGSPVDIFAMGLTFFAMLCFKRGNQMMVPSDNPHAIVEIGNEMRQLIVYGETIKANTFHEETVKIPAHLPEFKKELLKVIRDMIKCDQSQRLSASQVRKSMKNIKKA